MKAGVGLVAAFLLMLLSDYLKVAEQRRWGNACFLLGLMLFTASLAWGMALGSWFSVALPLRVLFFLLAALAALLEAVSLFGALPARETYLGQGETPLADRGMYALCRHPGALWLPALLLFLSLGLGSLGLLLSGALAAGLNVFYVWMQDRWVFPQTIPGYQNYRKHTPFLIPTRASVKKALATFRQD